MKESPDYFDELLKKEKEKDMERENIAKKIMELGEKYGAISSIPYLIKLLKENYDIKKKPWELAPILRDDLGMRYRKIKTVTMNTNSERNRVLRQQFALKFIQLLN